MGRELNRGTRWGGRRECSRVISVAVGGWGLSWCKRSTARMSGRSVRQHGVWLARAKSDELYEQCLGVRRGELFVYDVFAKCIQHLDRVDVHILVSTLCSRVQKSSIRKDNGERDSLISFTRSSAYPYERFLRRQQSGQTNRLSYLLLSMEKNTQLPW